MDFFDRILPKPVRAEQFLFYSEHNPDQLVGEIGKVFESTRGFVLSPNLSGEFTSTYAFRAQPKWSLLVINKGGAGPAVRMKGEVSAHGSGSLVAIRLYANGTLALFVLLPPALFLVWLIMVPKDRLPEFPSEAFLAPICLLVFMPAFALLSAWVAKRRFKGNFVRCFGLSEVELSP